MYDIAAQVRSWLDAGCPVTVARVVSTTGFSSRERAAASAGTPGEAPLGSALFSPLGLPDGFTDVQVDDERAAAAGLACGGTARMFVQSASTVPSELWDLLLAHEPLCLVTTPGTTSVYTRDSVREAGHEVAQRFRRGMSETSMLDGALVTVLWPVTTLVVVGDGLIAAALESVAALLGWRSVVGSTVPHDLTRSDAVVVLSHDRAVDGPAMQAALAGGVGYLGGLGSRGTQQARADWLAGVGVTDLSRVHGPAGLDIGANSPVEIAVSIVAEILAVRTGRASGSLRDGGRAPG